MIKLISEQELTDIAGSIDEYPLMASSNRLVTDGVIAAVIPHLDSQLNMLSDKVESHIILTRSLFLMNKLSLHVDFPTSKVYFTTSDNKEYYMQYDGNDELYNILSIVLDHSKYNNDESDEYEEYRNHTRIIFDNVDRYEGKSYRVLWSDICAITDSYFTNMR